MAQYFSWLRLQICSPSEYFVATTLQHASVFPGVYLLMTAIPREATCIGATCAATPLFALGVTYCLQLPMILGNVTFPSLNKPETCSALPRAYSTRTLGRRASTAYEFRCLTVVGNPFPSQPKSLAPGCKRIASKVQKFNLCFYLLEIFSSRPKSQGVYRSISPARMKILPTMQFCAQ